MLLPIVADGTTLTVAMALAGRALRATLEVGKRALGGMNEEVGRATRGFFAGDSKLDGRVEVEALDLSWEDKLVLDALEIESRIL